MERSFRPLMTDEAGRLVHDCREYGVAVGKRERSGKDERHPREGTCREKKTRRSRHLSIVASAPDAVEWCAPAVRRVPGASLRAHLRMGDHTHGDPAESAVG